MVGLGNYNLSVVCLKVIYKDLSVVEHRPLRDFALVELFLWHSFELCKDSLTSILKARGLPRISLEMDQTDEY